MVIIVHIITANTQTYDQPQNLYWDPLELMSDKVHGVKHKKLLVI